MPSLLDCWTMSQNIWICRLTWKFISIVKEYFVHINIVSMNILLIWIDIPKNIISYSFMLVHVRVHLCSPSHKITTLLGRQMKQFTHLTTYQQHFLNFNVSHQLIVLHWKAQKTIMVITLHLTMWHNTLPLYPNYLFFLNFTHPLDSLALLLQTKQLVIPLPWPHILFLDMDFKKQYPK